MVHRVVAIERHDDEYQGGTALVRSQVVALLGPRQSVADG
jgi:hypothetical protein